MKLTIKKDVLLENLLHVNKAISSKTPVPVLTGILFELNDNGLTLTGSDSDISIRAFIPSYIDDEEVITIEKTGSVVLQSKYITEIIKKIPNELINIEIIDGALTKIQCEHSEFNINGIEASEYPRLDMNPNNDPIIFNNEVFKTIVNQTVFAISSNENRPILTGVNFKLVGNVLDIVATDSYRLANKRVQLEQTIHRNINVVIPGKSLIELTRIVNGDNNLEMHIFGNKVLFKSNNIILQSRLLEGNYPDTSRLIPDSFDIELEMRAKDIHDAIDRASLLARDRSKHIVKFEVNNQPTVHITSKSPEIGKVVEDFNVNLIKTGELSISFSARYVMEAIKALNCDEVIVSFNGDMKPFIIKNVNDDSTTQLVLPVRTY